MDFALALVIVLLLAGIVGSILPGLPGPAISLVAILGYWIWTDFSEPGLIFLLVATVLCLSAIVSELLASALSAKAGGTPIWVGVLAGVVSLLLLFVFGPLGLLIGVAGTVFGVELYRTGDAENAARVAVYTTIGVLASTVVKVIVTVLVLIGFIVTVIL